MYFLPDQYPQRIINVPTQLYSVYILDGLHNHCWGALKSGESETMHASNYCSVAWILLQQEVLCMALWRTFVIMYMYYFMAVALVRLHSC